MDLGNTASLHSPGLAHAVRGQLMRLIAQGRLQPGSRLNEVHLAERFGISRGPVREAARELEGAGVLISRPRQGFYVVNFTPDEVRDIYETKNWLEDAFITDLAAHLPVAARQVTPPTGKVLAKRCCNSAAACATSCAIASWRS
jgi:DNA-binding GntR family transcriptional regulator